MGSETPIFTGAPELEVVGLELVDDTIAIACPATVAVASMHGYQIRRWI
jgi:hypothetical protein